MQCGDLLLLRTYRKPTKDVKECLYSLARWHNQTINVWTHLLGAVYFVTCGLAAVVTDSEVAPVDKLHLSVLGVGYAMAMGLRQVTHIKHNKSIIKIFKREEKLFI